MIYAIVAAIILIADQLLKYWVTLNIELGSGEVALIPGVIHLTNYRNYGAAYGILQNARWFFLIITVIFIALVIWLLVTDRIPGKFGRWTLVLVLAGALGNFISRLINGYVVDMLEFEFIDYEIFNIADIFISCCGVLFCLYVLFHKNPIILGKRQEAQPVDTPDFAEAFAPADESAVKVRQPRTKRTVFAKPAAPAAREEPAAEQDSPGIESVTKPVVKVRRAPAPDVHPINPEDPFAEWEEERPEYVLEIQSDAGDEYAEPVEPKAAEAVISAESQVTPDSAPEPKEISEPAADYEVTPDADPEGTKSGGADGLSLDDIIAEFSDRDGE